MFKYIIFPMKIILGSTLYIYMCDYIYVIFMKTFLYCYSTGRMYTDKFAYGAKTAE